MQTHSVKQGEKNQDESSDAKRRQRLVFIGDLCQKGRDIGSTVSAVFRRLHKDGCTTNFTLPTTVAFDRCSYCLPPETMAKPPRYLQRD